MTGEWHQINGLQIVFLEEIGNFDFEIIGEKPENLPKSIDSKDYYKRKKVNYDDSSKVATGITEMKLYPQKEEGSYRLDFALFIRKFYNGEWVETGKFNIECDGHAFHSSKEQISKDNARMRWLTLNGWNTIRLSGSEIYSKTEMTKFIWQFLNTYCSSF